MQSPYKKKDFTGKAKKSLYNSTYLELNEKGKQNKKKGNVVRATKYLVALFSL